MQRSFVRVMTIAVVLLAAVGSTGCEKTNHDNIDKWTHTSKGPDKLRKAFLDEDLDADLSAHAAVNMLKLQPALDGDVRAGLDRMSPGRRTQLIGEMLPKLWDTARVEDERTLPVSSQITAKDMLVFVRKYADDTQRAKIDGYLIDWYGVMSYVGRSESGSTSGANVMRLVGPAGGKKLIGVLNSIIASPGQEKTKLKIRPELLLGLAASGSPEAVKYVLEVARMDRGDPDLGRNAMDALRRAYVNSQGYLDDLQKPDALIPNIETLVAIARDDRLPPPVVDGAIDLLSAIPAPQCLDPLVSLINLPNRDRFKYVTAYNALHCGGAKAVVPVVKALPDTGAYARDRVTGSISGEIAKMTPRDQVRAALRELLGAKSTVAKWVAIEALLAMKSKEDAPKIRELSSNQNRLAGYWGEENPDHKPDPTLGTRAKEVADELSR